MTIQNKDYQNPRKTHIFLWGEHEWGHALQGIQDQSKSQPNAWHRIKSTQPKPMPESG